MFQIVLVHAVPSLARESVPWFVTSQTRVLQPSSRPTAAQRTWAASAWLSLPQWHENQEGFLLCFTTICMEPLGCFTQYHTLAAGWMQQ